MYQQRTTNINHQTNIPEEAKFSVAFLLLPEFALFAFSGFVDVLRLAADDIDNSQQRDCKWTIVAQNLKPVRSSCGVEILPWEMFSDPEKFDYLVVVGGRVEPQRKTDSQSIDYMKKFAATGKTIISICTASFVLARAELLKGHRCCVHWYHRAEFEEEFPKIEVDSDTIYIDENDRITCSGGRSSVDVAIHLIEKHFDENKARKVFSGLSIAQIRGENTPQPHAASIWYGEITNPLVKRSIILMDQSITKSLSIADISQRLNISENTFYRIFKAAIGISPARFFRMLRLANGHWSLKNTSIPISTIAHHYCFSDASHFSRTHTKYYGVTPSFVRLNREPEVFDMNANKALNKIEKQILSGPLFMID